VAKRILIVDDSPVVLGAARDVLVAAGYHVDTRNGVDDVGARGAQGFDLILMDVHMPELFGDDVASVLRQYLPTPIYLFSTMPEDELRERVREAKVDGFIAKDAGLEHLVSEIRRILG
jgi:CheY-like chemotaxis protein